MIEDAFDNVKGTPTEDHLSRKSNYIIVRRLTPLRPQHVDADHNDDPRGRVEQTVPPHVATHASMVVGGRNAEPMLCHWAI